MVHKLPYAKVEWFLGTFDIAYVDIFGGFLSSVTSARRSKRSGDFGPSQSGMWIASARKQSQRTRDILTDCDEGKRLGPIAMVVGSLSPIVREIGRAHV